jgi:hypothetical protein
MYRKPLFLIAFLFLILLLRNSALAESEDNETSLKIGPLLRETLKNSSTSPKEPIKVIVVINRDTLKPLPEDIIGELRRRAEDLGGYIGSHAYNNVQVWIPKDKIEIVAEWVEIKMIKAPIKPLSNSIFSEGGSLIGSYQWHPFGLTGKGIKVGVIDLGFKGYESLLGVELPSYVTTKTMGNYSNFTSSYHGTACAEIVHDMVPEAELFLVNAGDFDVDFHNAVLWLQSQGVDVISSSITINLKLITQLIYQALTYQNLSYTESQVQYIEEVKAQWENTVNGTVQQGIPWAQAAGNDGQKYWVGTFRDYDNDYYLNFGYSEDYNEIQLSDFQFGEEVYVVMLWGLDSNHDLHQRWRYEKQ